MRRGSPPACADTSADPGPARFRQGRSASTDEQGVMGHGAQFLHRIVRGPSSHMTRRLLLAALLACLRRRNRLQQVATAPTSPSPDAGRRAHFLHGDWRQRRHRLWQFSRRVCRSLTVPMARGYVQILRRRLRDSRGRTVDHRNLQHSRRGLEPGDRGPGARHRPADQRARRQLRRAAVAVRADQHDARHDLRRRQRRQRDWPRGARGTRRKRRRTAISTRRSGSGAPISTISSRASAAARRTRASSR